MEPKSYKPRHGKDIYRLGDSDDLVLMDHFEVLPSKAIRLLDHGVVFICTKGIAQLDYDGKRVEIHQGDLFLYCARCVVDNFMASGDFDSRQIWFSRSAMSDIDMMGMNKLSDLMLLKQFPKVTLSDNEQTMLDDYFRLLRNHMCERESEDMNSIVRSLFGSMLLLIAHLLRAGYKQQLNVPPPETTTDSPDICTNNNELAHQFVKLVEENEGRIRRIEDFAQMLNVTPKRLARQLKLAMGRTPNEIILFFTFKAIEYRLCYTNMTMQEIATDLNFSSASFFGRYVKKYFGMTPMDYRAMHQQNLG
jgi:AraC-like DNA-binding protein